MGPQAIKCTGDAVAWRLGEKQKGQIGELALPRYNVINCLLFISNER
jgi:hypothetical protein